MEVWKYRVQEILVRDDLQDFQLICTDESNRWNDRDNVETWLESRMCKRIIGLSAEVCAPKCLDCILSQYYTINPKDSCSEKNTCLSSLFSSGMDYHERMIPCINLLVRKYGADINNGKNHYDSLASALIKRFRTDKLYGAHLFANNRGAYFEIAKCILTHGATISDVFISPTPNEPFGVLIESRSVCRKKMTILIGILKKRRLQSEPNVYVRSSLRDLAPLIAYMGWQSRFDI
jgi:hypothetical protein